MHNSNAETVEPVLYKLANLSQKELQYFVKNDKASGYNKYSHTRFYFKLFLEWSISYPREQ